MNIFVEIYDIYAGLVGPVMDEFFKILSPIGINETNFQFMLIAAFLGISIYITLYGGMFSLANAGFMAIGAYVSVILTQRHEWAFIPAVLMGMVAAGVIAIPIGFPVLRLNDIYLAIATIGFGEVVVVLIRNFDKLYTEITDQDKIITGGATGIKGIPVVTSTEHLLLFLFILMYFLYRMQRSRFGRALVAIRQDAKVAANLGIHVVYYKNMAFILGAMIAGLAGGFSGHLNRIVGPEDYSFDKAVEILSYPVLGGTTTILGPVVGGMLLAYLPEALRRLDIIKAMSDVFGADLSRYEGPVRGMINGAILLLVIIFVPKGIANPETWKGAWHRLKTLIRPDEPSAPLALAGDDVHADTD